MPGQGLSLAGLNEDDELTFLLGITPNVGNWKLFSYFWDESSNPAPGLGARWCTSAMLVLVLAAGQKKHRWGGGSL